MEEKDLDRDKLLEICNGIYKKTLTYSLDRHKINEDGTISHMHSDKFLDEQNKSNFYEYPIGNKRI